MNEREVRAREMLDRLTDRDRDARVRIAVPRGFVGPDKILVGSVGGSWTVHVFRPGSPLSISSSTHSTLLIALERLGIGSREWAAEQAELVLGRVLLDD